MFQNRAALASVGELSTSEFRQVMNLSNSYARLLSLREFQNWSKVWEYPWIWTHLLGNQNWVGKRLLDIGTELSPMPWVLSAFGAEVTLVESDPQWIRHWEKAQGTLKTLVSWAIVSDETLPFESESFDFVTSFSVIEHQRSKEKAINEVARILKPGGVFGISFDICEREMGMSFPEWDGSAMTLKEFEDIIWFHPIFHNHDRPAWNYSDIQPFLQWHLATASHRNYVVGAAVLKKKDLEDYTHSMFGSAEAEFQSPRLEKSTPEQVSDDERMKITAKCRDMDVVPRVPLAGQLETLEDGKRVQIMHNCLRVLADGYYGQWMTQLIEVCGGYHEPQEERVFHEVNAKASNRRRDDRVGRVQGILKPVVPIFRKAEAQRYSRGGSCEP